MTFISAKLLAILVILVAMIASGIVYFETRSMTSAQQQQSVSTDPNTICTTCGKRF